jgi:hypothetical protein
MQVICGWQQTKGATMRMKFGEVDEGEQRTMQEPLGYLLLQPANDALLLTSGATDGSGMTDQEKEPSPDID